MESEMTHFYRATTGRHLDRQFSKSRLASMYETALKPAKRKIKLSNAPVVADA